MLHQYRSGTVMSGKVENESIRFIAKEIITSVEQLRNIDAGIESKEFRSATGELGAVFVKVQAKK